MVIELCPLLITVVDKEDIYGLVLMSLYVNWQELSQVLSIISLLVTTTSWAESDQSEWYCGVLH